ncbi:MAG: hypothetical protein CMJ78_04730 [Planctomycetaceae bacterium]|nr:hypothetical protein [Planctomycetaceae bacterium]
MSLIKNPSNADTDHSSDANQEHAAPTSDQLEVDESRTKFNARYVVEEPTKSDHEAPRFKTKVTVGRFQMAVREQRAALDVVFQSKAGGNLGRSQFVVRVFRVCIQPINLNSQQNIQ